MLHFKQQYNVMVLGLTHTPNGNDLILNPATNHPVKAGQMICFMAPQRLRINEIDWQTLTKAAA